MAQYYFIEPGEIVPTAKQAALAAAGIEIAQAALPTGTLSAGNMWQQTPPAVVNGVLTQQWTQVAAPVPTVQQQAQAILTAGAAIVSSGTPALNATYPLDTLHLDYLTSLVAGISAGHGLPNGASTVTLFDAAGVAHALTATDVVNLGAALRNVFYGCQMVLAGTTTTLPTQPATIA